VSIDETKKLIELLEKSNLRKLLYSKGDFSLEIEKEGMYYERPIQAMMPATYPMAEESKPAVLGKTIDSPMVGTFYSSPAPDQPPFVQEGDQVQSDTVVCIIEAMKVMNEVKAGTCGTIKKILVENAEPVEFGTNLFIIE